MIHTNTNRKKCLPCMDTWFRLRGFMEGFSTNASEASSLLLEQELRTGTHSLSHFGDIHFSIGILDCQLIGLKSVLCFSVIFHSSKTLSLNRTQICGQKDIQDIRNPSSLT